MIDKVLFLLSEGFRSLWRARLPALGSMLTITLTLMFFGGAYVIFGNFDRATRRLQSQYRIDVFFDPLLTNREAFRDYQRLKDIEGIASTEFISKERAAAIFEREFGEDVISVLGTNPLPAGAIVHVARGYRTARRINRIADNIAEISNVTDVAYRGELVRILGRYLRFAVYGGLVLGLAALLGAIYRLIRPPQLGFALIMFGVLLGIVGSARSISKFIHLRLLENR